MEHYPNFLPKKYLSRNHYGRTQINIEIENYYLTVSNPIQPKKSNDTSSGVGLNNLSNRCKLLLGEGIIVTKANNLFTVKVPLAYE